MHASCMQSKSKSPKASLICERLSEVIIDQCCTNLSVGMQDGSRAQTLHQKSQMNQKYPKKSNTQIEGNT